MPRFYLVEPAAIDRPRAASRASLAALSAGGLVDRPIRAGADAPAAALARSSKKIMIMSRNGCGM
jgi:hypothetical protein